MLQLMIVARLMENVVIPVKKETTFSDTTARIAAEFKQDNLSIHSTMRTCSQSALRQLPRTCNLLMRNFGFFFDMDVHSLSDTS